MANIIEIKNLIYDYVYEAPAEPDAPASEHGSGADSGGSLESTAGEHEPGKKKRKSANKQASTEYVRKTIRALDGVSLDIEEGSFTAIIGRNGSGKSTLAKNMNGLLLPTEGSVTVDGWDTRDEDHILDIRQAAGMVFQNPDNQLVSSVVEDDIAFGPENLGIDPDEILERIDKALGAVGMREYRYRAPHLLSGGQKQRIAIAGIIAMQPKCMIFDEPTAMLDPQGRAEVMCIINELHDRGVTIVLITHFMEEAADADRVVIMGGGHILTDGSPEEVFAKSDLIEEAGLDVPVAVRMADMLRAQGVDISRGVITEDQLADEIMKLKTREV